MENICGNGALVNWKSQGSASSVVKPLRPAFIGAPMENKASITKKIGYTQCFEGSSCSIRVSEALDAKSECHNQVTSTKLKFLNLLESQAIKPLRLRTKEKNLKSDGIARLYHGFNITLAESGMVVAAMVSGFVIAQIMKTEGVKSFYSGARAEILVCGAYNDTVLLIIYLAGVIRAAKRKSDNDSGSSSSFTIRWKDP
ncbi:hypothetical protein Gorai_005231 [Gossypium raimondii]|uniref:Uncharacterized protein n=1 Tax=Gossypium raimondii TaxID=29730 RepID=A0A7J8QBU8_GOSRA|nr:hypothetical protein [Gossypium raimondii]